MIAGLTLLPGRPAFSAAARTDSTRLPRPVATPESVPSPIGQASTAPDSSTNARTTARAPQRPVTSRPSATHGDRTPTPSLGKYLDCRDIFSWRHTGDNQGGNGGRLMSASGGERHDELRARIGALLRRLQVGGDRISATFASRQGLHHTDLAALIHIMDAEGSSAPLTPGQLQSALGLSSGAT